MRKNNQIFINERNLLFIPRFFKGRHAGENSWMLTALPCKADKLFTLMLSTNYSCVSKEIKYIA